LYDTAVMLATGSGGSTQCRISRNDPQSTNTIQSLLVNSDIPASKQNGKPGPKQIENSGKNHPKFRKGPFSRLHEFWNLSPTAQPHHIHHKSVPKTACKEISVRIFDFFQLTKMGNP